MVGFVRQLGLVRDHPESTHKFQNDAQIKGFADQPLDEDDLPVLRAALRRS